MKVSLIGRKVTAGIFFLASCGSGESENSKKPPEFQGGINPEASSSKFTSFAVAAAGDLPACKKEIEGSIAFLTSEKKLKVCNSGSWNEIDLKGEKGDSGAAGKDGEKGDRGEAGVNGAEGSTKIVATLFCTGDFSTLTTQQRTFNGITLSSNILVYYNSATLSNGDTFASAEVVDPAFAVSSTRFFAANQNGAENTGVVISSDYVSPSNFGYWNVSANRSTGVATVSYNDADFGLAPNRMEWTFLPSACMIQNY